jgi:hypothetical protein
VAKDVVYRRRRLVALGVAAGIVVVVAVVAGSGGDGNHAATQAAEGKPAPPPQLPRGGRRIFPRYEVVAYYGAPQDPQLGELGIGTPAHAGRKLLHQAAPYARDSGHPVLPAMELLADIADHDPGDDGLYRTRQPDAIIARYLRAARKIKALLILDIQPGHAGFFAESRHLERWLCKPDVSLALDPEWATPQAVPGTVIGSVDVHEINAISYWLEQIVRRHNLPQKLLVVHRFTQGAISDEADLKARRDVAVTVNVDGFGTNSIKVAKYKLFAQRRPGLHNGFKLFYHEDPVTMKPYRAMRIRPRPQLIVYE